VEVVNFAWDVSVQSGVIGKWATMERSTNGMMVVLRGKGRVIVDTCG